jgi:hypothetical protein
MVALRRSPAVSRQIAGFLGPVVIVLAASEAKNLEIWETGDPRLTYLAGLVWFLGGIVIVRLHNRWSIGWPLAITLVGWFFLIGGLFPMFFPGVQQGNENTPELATYVLDAVLLGLGAIMVFRAFWPRAELDAR